MEKIVIFASGSGTNAQRIVEYFQESPDIKVVLVLSNKTDAFVLDRAAKLNVPSAVFTRDELVHGNKVMELLLQYQVSYLILAGFLWMIPDNLLNAFPGRIINIHPALLPKYGGKGMYGMKVHKAVIEAGERESGITVHLVNEKYDEGEILFQARCSVDQNETPESLAMKIHQLEHKYFPLVIEKYLLNKGQRRND